MTNHAMLGNEHLVKMDDTVSIQWLNDKSYGYIFEQKVMNNNDPPTGCILEIVIDQSTMIQNSQSMFDNNGLNIGNILNASYLADNDTSLAIFQNIVHGWLVLVNYPITHCSPLTNLSIIN